ncbi:hypothetical protein LXA47_19855 [Massilia sp. P8910]|uniref:hypothetical protein n=1 Tax=Massilia antarctica TaxID=2765360 RepID=UPI001E44CE5A|nr:hypothetical protein [Massilia antarctica]MCE3605840.1 hypothetical protein [Massilia antarctica]
MNVIDYLEAKYGAGRVNTMLYCEAKAFGIPTNMPKGWLKQFGQMEITPQMAGNLRTALEKSSKSSSQDGLRVLDMAWPVPTNAA